MIWALFLLCLVSDSEGKVSTENNKANELFRSQHYQEALQEYLDLYAKNPDNGTLAYNLANTYEALGETEKAREFYQKAMKSQAEEAQNRSLYNLGTSQLKSQQYNDAIQNLVNYLKHNPQDMDAKRNLELALQNLQQQQQQSTQNQQDKKDQNEPSQSDQNQQSGQGSSGDPESDAQNSDQQEQNPPQQQEPQSNSDPAKQDSSEQPQNPEQGDQDEKDQNPAQNQKPQEKSNFDENMKEQILQALADQEQKTQEEHQKRKVGRVMRRAKDW